MTRSVNKQLFFNLLSTTISYGFGLGITFLLTPYVVSKIGIDAYGFLGLANNIIGYTLLITVALNSMMGRFVSIKYHEGQFDDANKYIASSFWTNTAFAIVMIPLLSIFCLFIEHFFDIPERLATDVKTLFFLLVLSTFISLAANAINLCTFIKNRLDLGNIRSIISNVIRVTILVSCFSLFEPRLWYFGLAALVCSAYTIWTYSILFKKLTPELSLHTKFFNIKSAIEITKAGAWNLLSQLSNILNQGFDLLLANVFLGATAMGMLSITKAVPLIIIGIFGALCGNFAPRYVELYAKERMDELQHELIKSVRIMGMFSAIPTAIIYGYFDIFYNLWLPGQDYQLLYIMTIIGCIGMNFALPFESLWYIFTLTNTVKKSSINLITYASITIVLVIIGLLFTQGNTIAGLFVLCSVRSILGAIRCATFLPLYGAKVLHYKRRTFYPALIRNLLIVFVSSIASLAFKELFLMHTWWGLVLGVAFTTTFTIVISFYFVLTKNDRVLIKTKIKSYAHNSSN